MAEEDIAMKGPSRVNPEDVEIKDLTDAQATVLMNIETVLMAVSNHVEHFQEGHKKELDVETLKHLIDWSETLARGLLGLPIDPEIAVTRPPDMGVMMAFMSPDEGAQDEEESE